MPLSVECPDCGTRYNVPDKLAGKRARCKKCAATIPIPAPAAADAPIGFAPDDDPMSALADLARASGEAEGPAPDVAPAPAAPRRRPGAAATIPADWTPESVIVERESAPPPGPGAVGSGRWTRADRRPVDPDVLARLFLFLFLAALVVVGVVVHQKLAAASAPPRGLVAWWVWLASFFVLCFLVLSPLTLLGPWVASRLFRRYLPDGALVRTAAVATLPLTLFALVSLGVVAGVVGNSLIWALMIALLPLTALLTVYLFLDIGLAGGAVGWVLAVVPYVVGLLLTFGIAKPIAVAVRGDAPGPGNGGQLALAAPGGLGSRWLPSMTGPAQRTEQTQSSQAQQQPHQQQPTQPQPPRPQDDPRRAESAAHLRQIYAALNTHRARTPKRSWPADLAALRQDGALDEAALKSPFGPAFASADYVYTPFVDEIAPGPDVVVAYDNAELSSGEGTNLLYATGQVRWVEKADAEAALKASEQARATAQQRHDQMLAMRSQSTQPGQTSSVFSGTPTEGSPTTPVPNPNVRVAQRADVADRIKAGSQGLVSDVLDVAVRKGTEQLIRPSGPSHFVGLLARDAQGDTVELFDGKSADPVQTAQFPTEQPFRNNLGAYALSPDGKLLARLVTFPKLRVSLYSFEKKAEAAAIDLPIPEQGAEPTLVGFLGNERLLVRWVWRFQYGLEVWDIKTAKRAKQVPLARVDPQPSAGSEAISPDGKTYAVLNKAFTNPNPRAPAAAAREQGMTVLLYDLAAGGTAPRRFPVPVLNDVPGVQALGLAFSPDKSKLALLLADPQGRAVVVTWPTNTGKPLPEKVLTEKLDSARVGFSKPRLLDWLAEGRVMLAGGKVLLNADTGDTLAILDAGKLHAQASAGEATAVLAHGDFSTLEGLAVISFNEARFPEKPGQPNRASPAPAR